MTDDEMLKTVRQFLHSYEPAGGKPTDPDPELVSVHWFRYYRDGTAGTQEVTLEVRDRGSGEEPFRWSVLAYDNDGRRAETGILSETIREALLGVQWQKLDEPPDGLAT